MDEKLEEVDRKSRGCTESGRKSIERPADAQKVDES